MPTDQHLLGHLQILPFHSRKHNFLLLPGTLFGQLPRCFRVHLTLFILAMSALAEGRAGQTVLIALTVVLLAVVFRAGTPFGELLHDSIHLHLHKGALKGLRIDVQSGLADVLDEFDVLHGVVATLAAALCAAETASSEADTVQAQAFALGAVAAFLGF